MIARKGNWCPTFTGRKFWPLDPRPTDVCIEDIAHHLAMEVRYAGAVRKFYSVAEHCVHVSRRVPPQDALWGLLHDASEAYCRDLNKPIKVAMPEYRRVEAAVMGCIVKRFRLPLPEPLSVKRVDQAITADEWDQLLPPHLKADAVARWGGAPMNVVIRGWTPQAAERNFLARFHHLMRLRGAKEAA